MDTHTTQTNGITLHYRIGFLILMVLAGFVMCAAGALIIIGSLVLFRPGAIVIGLLLGMGGFKILRRYGRAFLRRRAAFRLDAQGLHYDAPNGYSIAWSSVLGMHVCRRGARTTDLYLYLTESPINLLFMGEADPRAVLFAGHHAESPNQLHLRLSHFDAGSLGDVESAFRSFAPRQGAFPEGAQILEGHLSSLNWLFFTLFCTIVFGAIAFSIALSLGPWHIALLVFALFQLPAAIVWGSGWALRLSTNWATPRLIISAGTLYAPGMALGCVSLEEILNVRYRLGVLRMFFTKPQQSVRDSRYNPYGITTRASLAAKGNTRQVMADFFGRLHLWDNRKKPDLKKAKADQQRHNQEMDRLLKKYAPKTRKKTMA